MTRHFLILLIILPPSLSHAQKVISFGVFTGISMPFTFDQGINSDPRYIARNDIKLCPVGLNYGMDLDGFGFNLSPGIITTGQNFNVITIYGSHEGIRKIKTTYLNIPVGLKLHLIDLRFFKISFIASTGFAFLLDGKETITHDEGKLKFPQEVYPILPPDYTVENDGVVVPKISNYKMLSKKDFNKYQINIAFGFRSDYNVNDAWRVSLDLRLNYGLLEPRTHNYLDKLDSNGTLYDIPGKRRDIFANLNIGLSRYMFLKKKKTSKKKRAFF